MQPKGTDMPTRRTTGQPLPGGLARCFGRWTAGAVLAASLTAIAMPSNAGDIPISVGGFNASVSVQSVRERRWDSVIQQERDFSCGAAAVATLLTYHYERPTDEAEVFDAMFAAGDQRKILRQGFSMLDMKGYLNANGYVGDGFRVGLDELAHAAIPAISIIVIRGYRHFVVIKGVTDDTVLVGDPALGLKEYAREEFEAMMASDILFVVRNHVPTGREHFNLEREWAANPSAPFGSATQQGSLASFTLSLPNPNGFGGSR